MLKFTERLKTLEMASKKAVLSLKGIGSFTGDFVIIWTKQRLIWFNLQTDGTGNGLSNIKETFAENLQLKKAFYKRLVSQVHVMAAQNKCKEEVPNVLDPNQNVGTTCNSKLKFT